jgi:putative endonuclease
MTNELSRRIYEHKNGLVDGFTKMYKVHKLVHYESQPDFASATKRKTIKKLA